jgi:hypothetical protein
MSRPANDSRPASPFRDAARPDDERHPVDAEVDRRLPQVELRRRIREAEDAMTAALGSERIGLWLALESLLNERRFQREEAYYDLGHEHGAAAARAEVRRAIGIGRHEEDEDNERRRT